MPRPDDINQRQISNPGGFASKTASFLLSFEADYLNIFNDFNHQIDCVSNERCNARREAALRSRSRKIPNLLRVD